MKLINLFILILIFFLPVAISAQENNDSVPEGFKQFFYPNGKLSSEGVLINGKPDGYWKNYHENGKLKSEGKRVDFLLDGEWKFYDENGILRLLINYQQGLKQGKRITWTDNERIEENFKDDIKDGLTLYFDNDGFITRSVPYEEGRENGFAKIFDKDSTVIILMEYRRGVAISREFINRYDKDGLPHGVWKTFYPSGVIKADFSYKNGKLDGYSRKYDWDGNMVSITRYIDGEMVVDSDEVYDLQIRRDYFPDMRVRIEGTYRDGLPHGVRKEFNPDGSLKVAYLMDMGRLLGYGFLDQNGNKQGYWKEFYSEGGMRAEGTYVDGIRTGEWTFYFNNGVVEQKGVYNQNGKEQGKWVWYYSDGKIRREESHTNGRRNGEMTEFGDDGEIIAKGVFIDDEEDGSWYYQENGYRQEGNYIQGEKDGEWKHFFSDGKISFTGKFMDGYPDGKHSEFNPDGTFKSEGIYIMGIKHGIWRYFDETGNLIITIEYRNGIEIKYDYQLIKPEIKGSEL